LKIEMTKLDQMYDKLTLPTKAKIALVVLDGVGDIAIKENGYLTPLEAAKTPIMDKLSREAIQGRMTPVAPGVTPGSGPGHLALFGYDPVETQVGRGVIEALGLGLELKAGDVAARANFCSLDADGLVTDRRAGRIETEECERLCAILSKKIKKVSNTQIIIQPGKGHRFVVIFRGTGMEGPLNDTDPQREGLPIAESTPLDPSSKKAQKAAKLIKAFYDKALPILKDERPANGFLMRGIAHQPDIPTFEERYKLKAACLAVYPMYKGLAQLVGMDKVEGPQSISEQFNRYLEEYDNYDFFFIHYKYTDMYGEDGNFEAKKKAIEELDEALPILLQKRPDVIAITGDHSTPCPMKGHSWHPQPVLLTSAFSGSDKLDRFTETGANIGSMGVFDAKFLIRHMQAHAMMFDKYGA
jgi:2,3-bisphosphoglycerate-independent phosphoglycerate mutase